MNQTKSNIVKSQIDQRKLVMILGIPIDEINMPTALDKIDEFIRIGRLTGKSHQIATVNADFVVKTFADPELRFLLQEADMTTADGMPLVWGARLLGVNIEGRVTGADLVPALVERAAQKNYSIYFLGAAPGVAARAAEIMREKHPDLIIAGINSPPYSSIFEMDPAILEDIKASKPDILFVAFGNPKQEKWIGLNQKYLAVPVMIGVGATLDFIARNRKRAPRWMQKIGMEWLFRLLQEPRRLWRRYAWDLFIFGPFFLRQWWLMRQGNSALPALSKSNPVPKSAILFTDNQAIISLYGRQTMCNSANILDLGQQALAKTAHIVVNLAEVQFLDSSALGALVGLAKRARDAGGDLALVSVSAPIKHILSILCLDSFFIIHEDLDAGLNKKVDVYWGETTHTNGNGAAGSIDDKWVVLQVPRRLDANTTPLVQDAWLARVYQEEMLILDFSDTVLVASAGLAFLAQLDRLARKHASELRLTNCSQDVLNIFQITRFDQVLALYPDLAAAKI